MLVSVVMPSFNQASYIAKAIDSVLSQSYGNIELVVMDGGSTDKTLDILATKQKADNRLRWWSEEDSGPANAINKALAKTRGTIIGWLNSDDMYADNAVESAVNKFRASSQSILCYGDGSHIDENDKHLSDYPTVPHRQDADHIPPDYHAFSDHCFICQPAVFFKRSMYTLQGGLDDSFKASFDFEFWLRAFKNFPSRIAYIPDVLAYSRLHDECITHNNRSTVSIEGMKLLHKHKLKVPAKWAISYFEERKSKDIDWDNPNTLQVIETAEAVLSNTQLEKLQTYIQERKHD